MPKKLHRLAFFLIFLLSCSRDGVLTLTTPVPLNESIPGDEIRFGKIISDSELVPGPGATGWFGDFKLYNSRVGFILQGNLTPPDRRLLPGTIIDAGWAEPGALPSGDLLFGLTPWLEDSPARVGKIEFQDGAGQGRATVTGRLEPQNLDYQATYALYPGDDPRGRGLLIKTTISNPGSSPQTVNPGDWISFGGKLGLQVLDFPGGHKLLAAIGPRISYLYVPTGLDISSLEMTPGGAGIHFPETTLAPGESWTGTRWLLISRHGLLEANPILPNLLGFSPGTLRVLIPNVQAQEDLSVKIFSPPDVLNGIWAPDQEGNLSAQVPAGSYRVKIESPGLEDYYFPSPVTVSAGAEKSITVTLPEPSRARFQIWEENNGGYATGPSPAKLCFQNLRRPEIVVRAVTATGSGETLLPPGIYEVSASRGTEYSLKRFRFGLQPGETFAFHAALRKVLNNDGYYSFDPRQRTGRSAQGNLGREDWLKDNLAEGLSLLTPVDINAVTQISSSDFLPGYSASASSLTGLEILPETGPPFLLFPAVFDRLSGWGGAPLADDPETIWEIYPAYSRPRLLGATPESLAYLVPSSDPVTAPVRLEFPLDFVEISDAAPDLNRWFALLNSGYLVTAVGGSGAGSVEEGIGFPRTLIPRETGSSDPETDLVNAIRTRKALVSAGPRLRMRADYYGFDSAAFISDTSGDIDLEIELESPVWTPVSELIIFGNGQPLQTIPVDFSAAVSLGGHRFSQHYYLNLPLAKDTWFVALVRGQDSLAPVYPGHPFAFTNPIWVDADGVDRDGDGRLFDALNSPLP
ncbi:MAG: hypothetical protein PHE84_04715 [bacterium]|nr:hypothetical protein [bacterium]